MSAGTDLASAIGQCVASATAIVGLGAIWWQVKESRKASDLLALQAFLKDAREHEGALLRAASDDEKDSAFVDLLNFLELYAAAYNGKLFPKISRRIVRLKLRDTLSIIQKNELWHNKLIAAMTSPDTFEELSKFMLKKAMMTQPLISA